MTTEVGEVSQMKVVECEHCSHRWLARIRGFYILWWGKDMEWCMKTEVECENCLRDTGVDVQPI